VEQSWQKLVRALCQGVTALRRNMFVYPDYTAREMDSAGIIGRSQIRLLRRRPEWQHIRDICSNQHVTRESICSYSQKYLNNNKGRFPRPQTSFPNVGLQKETCKRSGGDPLMYTHLQFQKTRHSILSKSNIHSCVTLQHQEVSEKIVAKQSLPHYSTGL
jgi:hypothetical protein